MTSKTTELAELCMLQVLTPLIFGVFRVVTTGPLPLVPSVLISTESSGQIEGAVRSQPGVHPLGEMKDLGRRERFPLALFSLEPTLAAAR